jgi:hypothetical protein
LVPFQRFSFSKPSFLPSRLLCFLYSCYRHLSSPLSINQGISKDINFPFVVMVGVSTFVLLGLGLLRLGAVAQDTPEIPTLDDVDAQLSAYLELVGNGTVATEGPQARSLTLPSGCDLAVRKSHRITTRISIADTNNSVASSASR